MNINRFVLLEGNKGQLTVRTSSAPLEIFIFPPSNFKCFAKCKNFLCSFLLFYFLSFALIWMIKTSWMLFGKFFFSDFICQFLTCNPHLILHYDILQNRKSKMQEDLKSVKLLNILVDEKQPSISMYIR